MKTGKRTQKILIIVCCCFCTAFLMFSALFLVSLYHAREEAHAFKELAEVVAVQPEESDYPPQVSSNESSPEPLAADNRERFAALLERSSDFVGWLHIDNTNINYPVMCSPDEPEYYLRRAFDKTDSQSGTPFVGKGSTIDSDFYIINGHNMKNDTMFGTLDYYAERTFWEDNPYITFSTITEEREYEVFAVLETRILYQDEPGYRYYFQVGDLTKDTFDELTGWLQKNALYDTGIAPAYGEQIVVLSTCSYHEDNGRFIVAARRVNDAE